MKYIYHDVWGREIVVSSLVNKVFHRVLVVSEVSYIIFLLLNKDINALGHNYLPTNLIWTDINNIKLNVESIKSM